MATSTNPNRHLKPEAAALAVEALLNWTRNRPKHQKAQLFEPDDPLYLLLTLNRIPPTGRTNPYRIPLPHPLHPFDPQSTSICLLTSDPQSAPVLARIREDSLPISTVIGLSDLRSDYRPYESRRKLCDSYDLFFADRKILPLLPRLLGKHFFKKKQIPLAVDLSRPGWPEQVRAFCGSTLLYLRTGTCCAMKVGRVTMGREEIVENVMAAIEGAVTIIPRKWGNIRSMHLKYVESPALPIYEVLPEIGLKIEGIKDNVDGEVLDEEVVVVVEGLERKKVGKKGRIHEVDYMDGHDVEVIDGDDQVEELEVEEGKKKRKKGKKESRAMDEVMDNGVGIGDDEVNDGGDLSGRRRKKKKNSVDDEGEDLTAKKRKKKNRTSGDDDGGDMSAKKRKTKKKVEVVVDDSAVSVNNTKNTKKSSKAMVEESERSGADDGNLTSKKKMKKKMKDDGKDSADELNTKKNIATTLEKKEVKKAKRSKLRLEVD